ncbi:MAG: SH3 domain-containing protein [Clostridia bacterium]|nr:SH3 domain-containing protein [Clostridia bacterium]
MTGKRILALFMAILCLLADIALAEDYYAKITDKTTVYASASTSSSKLGSVDSGTWVFWSATKDGWAKISLNGKTGYVSTSKVKKTAKAVYVKTGTAVLYKSQSTSSTKLATLGYGQQLDGWYKEGDWTKVTYGNTGGYIKTSSITATNPCTMKKAGYIQASEGKVYKLPDTSSSSWEVSGTVALTCTGVYNSTWARVTYGSKVGYVKYSLLGTSKYTAPSKSSSSSSASSSSSTKSTSTSDTKYVGVSDVTLYKTASANASKAGNIVYGCKVTVTETDGSWCKVKYGSVTGWCKSSCLVSKNPNTLNQTVYVKDKSVKIYEKPSTSSSYGTVSTSAALTCTAMFESTWCRVTYNGKIGFVQKSNVSTTKGGTSTASAAPGHSVKADWFKSGIQSTFYRGRVVTVTDVKTGISFKVRRKGGYNHADVEPYTAADTAAMKKACGSDFLTWHRRPIWVSINGTKYAASMNCMNHGECTIKDNNFDGHFCIHFTNSRTHGSDKVDGDHQAAINRAYAAG